MSRDAATELSRAGLRPKGMTSPSRLLPVLVVPILVLSACGANTEPTGTTSGAGEPESSVSTDLQQAVQRWASVGPVSYRMTLVSSCGERNGLGVFRVTVTPGGTSVEAVDRASDETDIKTIPDLFAFIDETAASGAEVVDVEYDTDLGYPQKIDVDYVVDAIDDEACYTVKDFEPLGLVD
ncbi:MAG: DUF6174 domain-containing protein [Actinomycetia bacterium]|nr:DUF6174 domain-containing protein [Actinomycetes bacterium]